ncbi:hypothetical protein DL93DRAFT_447455 [Clavulina sp. PMI_390]|nr:hypothetical protein DL93DRAFT_447455 [Clavulina sp. PMI_390]
MYSEYLHPISLLPSATSNASIPPPLPPSLNPTPNSLKNIAAHSIPTRGPACPALFEHLQLHIHRLWLDLSIPPPRTRCITSPTHHRMAQQRAYRWGSSHLAPGLAASVCSRMEEARRSEVKAMMVLVAYEGRGQGPWATGLPRSGLSRGDRILG